jgi:hypothetical protein
MKLILTEAEKKAATWLELDNDSLGKFVKANISHLKEKSENIAIFTLACATALCSMAAEANAGTFILTFDGLKNKSNDFGNWKVTIRRMN